MRTADDRQRVHRDVGHGAVERKHRLRRVVLRAEQARFLQRGHEEQDAALGRRALLRERAGDFQQHAQAGAVVDRAAVHLVPRPRRVGAQVIPVRGVDDHLVGLVVAGDHRQHVLRFEVADLVPQADRGGRAERHGLESRLRRCRGKRVEILAGGGEQARGGGMGEPAGHRQARRGVDAGRQAQLRAAVAVLQHAERITRRRVAGVHDETRRRALQRGLGILVGPAPVVGHGAAVEKRRIATGKARIVDQHDHRLALHVHAGVIVPVPVRRIRAVAEEHHRRILQVHLRFPLQGLHHHVLLVGETGVLRAGGDLQLHLVVEQQGALRRHGLEPGTVVAGLQPHALELVDQEIQRALRTDRAGLAPAEVVGTERLLVAGKIGGVDRRRQRCRLGGRVGGHGR